LVGYKHNTCILCIETNTTNSGADQAELDVESLTEWLRETYYDEKKPQFFASTDLERIGEFLLRLLRYRSSERPSAGEILSDPLFGKHIWDSMSPIDHERGCGSK